MGAFNTVICNSPCPNCGVQSEFVVQFKYAETWQYKYRVGDTLKWSDNPRRDIGSPEYRKVVIDGAGGPCKSCGNDDLDFDIIVEQSRVASVSPHSSKNSFTGGDDTFIVLDE